MNTVRHRSPTPEQVIRKLRKADKLLAEGVDIATVARHHGVSEQTYHRWRNQYGGMKADDAKRLKELERENGWLKRIGADQVLDIEMLKEVAKGNFLARHAARPSSGAKTNPDSHSLWTTNRGRSAPCAPLGCCIAW
jgi:putative transposase